MRNSTIYLVFMQSLIILIIDNKLKRNNLSFIRINFELYIVLNVGEIKQTLSGFVLREFFDFL